jgi:membrane associated rhomboid family serine protease
MGIYDRDYYRKDGGRFFHGLGGGQVCKALILVNVLFFVVQLATRQEVYYLHRSVFVPGWFENALILQPDKVLHGEVWRLLTCAFLHSTGDIFHILFNMLFLWWFGKEMEDMYGPWEFLTFYLTAAVAASLGYVAAAYLGLGGQRPQTPALGASGAVTAVMVLYACYYPSRPINLYFLLTIPVWLLVIFQVVKDFVGLFGMVPLGPVAFAAHLGGAAFGALYFWQKWRILAWLPRRSDRAARPARRPALKVYRDEEPAEPDEPLTAPAALPAGDSDEHLEAKLDEVLEKVAKHGQGSLSESERQILFRASEIYKRRRK